MTTVRAKKGLGQHFLKDENIACKIVDSLSYSDKYSNIIEVGPGMGVLTKYLLTKKDFNTFVIEVDKESVDYLQNNFPELGDRIIAADFLRYDLQELFKEPFAIIGNFPYNISSQILFKALENKNLVPEIVGTFQLEMAQRIAASPNNKTYGILSVFLQAYYTIEYLFTVNETVFSPPPKVKSAVVRLTRNDVQSLDCDEKLFFKIVKTTFNQRRKMLRNTLKTFGDNIKYVNPEMLTKRPENLTVDDFVQITRIISDGKI